MKREAVHWRTWRLTVSEATVAIGLERRRLVGSMDLTSLPLDLQLLAVATYPDLISATVEHSGFEAWPVTFDAFVNDLPEELVKRWEDAVYSLNPHWQSATMAARERQRQNADELHRRLTQRFREREDAKRQAPELPELVPLNNLETSYRVWQLMEATGWHYRPSELLSEPDWMMDDILTIAGQAQVVERMLSK